jgi:hypothetical protein
MAQRPPIKVFYDPRRTYPGTRQRTFPGAPAIAEQFGIFAVPPALDDGAVHEMVQLGDRVVFIGSFSSVAGSPRSQVAAFSLTTGLLDAGWAPTFLGGGPTGIATDGEHIYLFGTYTSVNGFSTLAGLPVGVVVRFAADGTLDQTWNPGISGTPLGAFHAAADPASGVLYAAAEGDAVFTLQGGATRTRAFALDVATPTATHAWDPAPDAKVFALELDAGSGFVYLGGDFGSVGGAAVSNLARVSAATGAADSSWAPTPGGTCTSIARDVLAGLTYAGARNGFGLKFIKAYDDAGAATSFSLEATGGTGDVTAITLGSTSIFVAGGFTAIGGVSRSFLAALTYSGNVSLDWDPSSNAGGVFAFILSGQTLYVGGPFTSIAGGHAQRGLDALPTAEYPTFTDGNSRFVAKTGSDAAAGTRTAPYLTIGKGLAGLTGAFRYVVVLDSGTYEETLSVSYAGASSGGLYADFGQAPIIAVPRGANEDALGARTSGRTTFYTGSSANIAYVSKDGNDATAVKGDPTKPFLTIQAAINATVSGDAVQIQDSFLYQELLTAPAFALTIQAADGQVPTVRSTSLSNTITVPNLGNLTLLGIAVVNDWSATLGAADSPSCVFSAGGSGTSLRAEDCTFSGFVHGVRWELGTCAITSCYFRDQSKAAVLLPVDNVARSLAMTNCLVERAAVSGEGDVEWVGRASPASSVADMIVRRCTFRDSRSSLGSVRVRGDTAGTGTFLVEACTFDRSTQPDTPGAGVILTQRCGESVTVRNCLFSGLGGPAVDDECAVSAAARTFRSLVADRCCRHALSVGASFFAGGSAATAVAPPEWSSCASLHSVRDGFQMSYAGAAGSVTVSNCVALGSAERGFDFSTNIGGTLKNSAERGSVLESAFRQAAGSATLRDCVFSTSPTWESASVTRLLIADPAFLDVTSGSANVALSATSPCHNYVGPDAPNAGLANSLIVLFSLAAPFTVQGFILSGDPNFHDGITDRGNLAHRGTVRYCTFRGLAVHGIRTQSGMTVQLCDFQRLNGEGVNVNGAGSEVSRSVALACGGAAVLVDASGVTVEHVTASGCQFGQFDRSGSGLYRDNVFSGNAEVDYSGPGVQENSAVELVSADAEVEGTRLNPLFRIDGEDLRLQTVEVGFPVDSPAKGLAHDGTDAGAYLFDYGGLVEEFTMVDFGTGAGDSSTAYRNPDHVERRSYAVKLSEGETFGGVTYSRAPTYKREYLLSWDPDNAMPPAQVDDLKAIYETGEGECRISFDGDVTRIPVRVVRSQGFRFVEVEGAFYSDDSLPTPVNELLFRESA